MGTVWCIASHRPGEMVSGGRNVIQSSIGRSYHELKAIARRMNSNPEGWRYAVVRHVPTAVDTGLRAMC